MSTASRWFQFVAPALTGLLIAAGCAHESAPPTSQAGAGASAAVADTIYLGGPIVTVNDAAPAAEALAVKDGKILAVGSKAEVMKTKGAGTGMVDLKGKAMLPAFLDGHSHFINALTVAGMANVYPPPFGPGNSVEGIVEALKRQQKEQDIQPGGLIRAYGYDDNALPEGGKLTAEALDAHFPDHVVMVDHVSMHGAVLNTRGLKKYNITAQTKTPPGGVILRKPGSEEPSGLVMETAYLPIFSSLPKPSVEESMASLEKAQRIYAAAGITTAHEGASHLPDLEILKRGSAAGKLFIDVVAFPFITELEGVLKESPVASFGQYRDRFKLGGIKITMDGSPQGKTAWFTKPYLTPGPGGEEGWKGEPTFPVPILNKMVKSVYDAGLPLIVHCNGDAAIEAFLAAHEATLGDRKAGDHRTSIIHCQFVRPDQLDKIAAWKIIPSFYTEHTYFFSTTHLANRGREQTEFLSPLKTALAKGIRFSNHTDFYVAPLDQLFLLWSAVNRISREGQVVGPGERIAPLDAIKAITLNTAYWYREEKTKGSLEVGKLADLVVLDKNPLTVDPMTIKDIKVVETIKEGKSIYVRN